MTKVDDKTKFSQLVEKRALEEGISNLESLVIQCDEMGIEPDTAKKLVSPSLKEKLRAEAQALHYLPSDGNKLPMGD